MSHALINTVKILFMVLMSLWAIGVGSDPTLDEQLQRIDALQIVDGPNAMPDPYEDARIIDDSGVCAVLIEGEQYQLRSYETALEARAEGAKVTHLSPCGTCSTLQDLAVYLRHPDLTTPVRRCAMLSFSETLTVSCLKRLGFTDACAQTWFYNARHTARHCTGVCFKAWLIREPNNTETGELNACLACDEALSGPVFKQAAGRTRRNSGIESAIVRGSEETATIQHDY